MKLLCEEEKKNPRSRKRKPSIAKGVKKIKGAGEATFLSKNKLDSVWWWFFTLESAEGKCLYNRALFGVNISSLRVHILLRISAPLGEGEDDDEFIERHGEKKEIRLCGRFFSSFLLGIKGSSVVVIVEL